VVTPQVVAEFLQVVTDPKRFSAPLTMEQALERAKHWCDAKDKGLRTVDLDGLIIDREAIGHLAACKGLRWVTLRSDLPKGITLEKVRKSLPNCTYGS
jgi:hypothetical protein